MDDSDSLIRLAEFLETHPPLWLFIETSEPSLFLHYVADTNMRGGHHTGVILQGEARETDHWSDLMYNYNYYAVVSGEAAVVVVRTESTICTVFGAIRAMPGGSLCPPRRRLSHRRRRRRAIRPTRGTRARTSSTSPRG